MSSNFLEINNATFIASDNNKVKNVSLTIKKKGGNCLFTRTIWCWKNYYSKNNCRSTKS